MFSTRFECIFTSFPPVSSVFFQAPGCSWEILFSDLSLTSARVWVYGSDLDRMSNIGLKNRIIESRGNLGMAADTANFLLETANPNTTGSFLTTTNNNTTESFLSTANHNTAAGFLTTANNNTTVSSPAPVPSFREISIVVFNSTFSDFVFDGEWFEGGGFKTSTIEIKKQMETVDIFHSFRVYFVIFSTRFECIS